MTSDAMKRLTTNADRIAEESAIAHAQALMYRAMETAGLSQAGLARRLGVSRATVTMTLSGGGPRVRTVARWLRACGFTLKLSLGREP